MVQAKSQRKEVEFVHVVPSLQHWDPVMRSFGNPHLHATTPLVQILEMLTPQRPRAMCPEITPCDSKGLIGATRKLEAASSRYLEGDGGSHTG